MLGPRICAIWPELLLDPKDITGLILAGGQGRRMGGVDKGLQPYQGSTLAQHALQRLAPQVGQVMINANRNLGLYESMGVPVWPDTVPGFVGPLAGFLTGLEHCQTPYLVTVPCDSPLFPTDLVARLAQALRQVHADIAMAVTHPNGARQAQPAFCLLKANLGPSLTRYLESGQRQIEAWTAQQRRAEVVFSDAGAFANANTLDELQLLDTVKHANPAPTA